MKVIGAGALDARVERIASALAAARPRVVGLIADNGPDWLAADLAAQKARVVLVPLPEFFTDAQRAHAAAASGMDGVIGSPLPGFEATGEIDGLRFYRREGRPVVLQRREFMLLQKLLAAPGQVLTRAQLEESLYGWDGNVESNALDVHVHNLRRKLYPGVIRTVRGVGYVADPPA